MNDLFPIIATIATAIIAALPGIWALRNQKKIQDAEAEKIQDEITNSVLARAKTEIDSLYARITEMEALITKIQKENERLIRENVRLRSRVRQLESRANGDC